VNRLKHFGDKGHGPLPGERGWGEALLAGKSFIRLVGQQWVCLEVLIG